MNKLRSKKPKVKMRSYGGGEKLPVVKSGGNFYLSGGDYDSKGHGKFIGETTSKLEGPSKRAIKGKGKKSANVRVSSRLEGGDPIFLEDTSPMKMKNDYSSMKSMGQSVAQWTSPVRLIENEKKGYYTTGNEKQEKARFKKKDTKAEIRAAKKIAKKESVDEVTTKKVKEAVAKKRTKATKDIQTLGSLLKDIGKPTSKVKKAGVAAETPEEKPKTKKPLTIDNKKNKITANIVEFQKK
tara:strand:+ start:11447 stop:12163 length:717 start_codon:yes stop_codon:yes gene_type:complete